MRRTALQLLLRASDAATAEQLSQQGQLTRLQALLLQETGHIGHSPSFFSRLPPQLGRMLFGAAREGGDANLNADNRFHYVIEEEAVGQRDSRGCGPGDGRSVDGAIIRARRRRRNSISEEELSLLILPSRTRRPDNPASQAARAAPPTVLPSTSAGAGKAPPDGRRFPHQTTTPSSCPAERPSQDPLGAPLNVSGVAVAGARTAAMAAFEALSLPASGSSIDASASRQSAFVASAEHAAGPSNYDEGSRHIPPQFDSRRAASRPSCLPPAAASPTSGTASGCAGPLSRSQRATASATSKDDPTSGPFKSIHELLDALERGSAPPSPHHFVGSLKRWRDQAAARSGKVARHGSAATSKLTARLDRVFAPLLRGEYGREMHVRHRVNLFWSLIKAGLNGDTTLALVQLLEDVVQPDMPYSTKDYWASLAFYSLALARQAAAGANGGGGGAGGGIGSSSSSAAVGAAAAAAVVARSRRTLAPALLALLSRNASTINQQALANTFWAAGLLGLRDHAALTALGREICERAHELEPQGISNTMYGCVMMNLKAREWAAVQGPHTFLERLLSEVVQRRFAGFKPQEVSCIVWSMCKLPGLKTGHVMEAVADFIGRGGYSGLVSPQVWANTVYAMGLIDFYDPRVFQELSRAVLQIQPPPPPPAAAAAATSCGCGSNPQHLPPSPSSSPLPSSPPLLHAATSQTCCNILFAMGTVRHLDERLVDALLAHITAMAAAGRAELVDVALSVRACAQLNYRSPQLDDLLDAALPAMKAQAPRLMAYNVLWSLLMLEMLIEPRHQPLVQHLVYCTNRYGTTTWKSASKAAASETSSSSSSSASTSASDLMAYDDLTQLVQYHVESRYLGLTGEAYDLTPPYGMDAIVQHIRKRRQEIAAMSTTKVHRQVVDMLKAMATAQAASTAADPAADSTSDFVAGLVSSSSCSSASYAGSDGDPGGEGGTGDPAGVRDDLQQRMPRILKVESEVMVEPELVVVDVLLTLQARAAAAAAGGAGGGSSVVTYQVALEVDGPHHYMRNRWIHKGGSTAYRDRVLARRIPGAAGAPGVNLGKLGGAVGGVVTVPTRTWVEMMHDDDDARRRYLTKLLAATAPSSLP